MQSRFIRCRAPSCYRSSSSVRAPMRLKKSFQLLKAHEWVTLSMVKRLQPAQPFWRLFHCSHMQSQTTWYAYTIIFSVTRAPDRLRVMAEIFITCQQLSFSQIRRCLAELANGFGVRVRSWIRSLFWRCSYSELGKRHRVDSIFQRRTFIQAMVQLKFLHRHIPIRNKIAQAID